jgi:hypothetical protein
MGLTFAPMTAAAMREVPPRIAGSASGILNTFRNIGQVLGIAVLGSWLQDRIGANTQDRLAAMQLDPGTSRQVVDLAKQNQFDQIRTLVPDPAVQNAVLESIRHAFVDSLHSTYYLGALACLVATSVALLIRNPAPRAATAPAEGERPSVAIAD